MAPYTASWAKYYKPDVRRTYLHTCLVPGSAKYVWLRSLLLYPHRRSEGHKEMSFYEVLTLLKGDSTMQFEQVHKVAKVPTELGL